MTAMWKYVKAKIKQEKTKVLCVVGAVLLTLYICLLWLGALDSLRSQSSARLPASLLIILFLLVFLFASSELKELIDRFRKWL